MTEKEDRALSFGAPEFMSEPSTQKNKSARLPKPSTYVFNHDTPVRLGTRRTRRKQRVLWSQETSDVWIGIVTAMNL